MAVDAEHLTYPVIAFSGDYFEIRRSPQELTTNYLGTIRAGHYNRMTVVERRGKAYRVVKVIVPRVGLVRSLLNPLVGQLIRVQLELEETEKPWDVEKVRAAVRREFKTWDGWESRDDYEEVIRGVNSAGSVEELIGLLDRAGRGGVGSSSSN